MRLLSKAPARDINGKVCLLRVDFNIEGAGEHFRLKASLPTIEFLRRRGATVLIISHRGRPAKRCSPEGSGCAVSVKDSLRMALSFLKTHFAQPITFAKPFNLAQLAKKLRAAKPGSLFLMENVRLLEGEEEDSPRLGRQLAALGDVFINDAFSVCHRANASVTQIPRFLPSYAGLRLEKEVEVLSHVMQSAKQPLVVILGGAKISDKIGVIDHFMPRAARFLIGGAVANTFLAAQDVDIQKSFCEPEMVQVARDILAHDGKILLPSDFVIHQGKFLDIGAQTVKQFAKEIAEAKTIIWNGPMGLFEQKRFMGGSSAIAKAVAKAKAFTVIGGGETTQLIHELGLERKYDFISTGGGAMLAFLAGKKLPGIEALK